MTFWNTSKVAIIGCGFVGSTIAYSLAELGLFSEIALLDTDFARAEGEALDISHGLPFNKPAKIYAADYSEIADADMIIMSAGFNRRPNDTRIDLAKRNMEIMRQVCEQVNESGFMGIMLVVANPVDILTYGATRYLNLPAGHVLGSGTMLDSGRFKIALAELLGFDPRNVHAGIIGEHGDSELPVWSTANVSGVPIDECFKLRGIANAEEVKEEIAREVREGGSRIIRRKGATYFGVASAVRHICEAVMRDEKSIMTVSTVMEGAYGLQDVALSVPCVVGRDGVELHMPATIDTHEQALLEESAAKLREVIDQVI